MLVEIVMATEFIHAHSNEGMPLPHPSRFGESTRTGNWEEFARDPLSDQVSAGDSLSILACREYDENGPSCG